MNNFYEELPLRHRATSENTRQLDRNNRRDCGTENDYLSGKLRTSSSNRSK